MGVVEAIAGTVLAGGGLAALGMSMGGGGSKNNAIPNMSDPNQKATDIVGEKAQLASSENNTMRQENMQSQVTANNQQPGMYIDNPRRSLAQLARGVMNSNNQNGVGK